MAGIISIPTAAVVAGPEPEIAPKNTQANAVETASPPGMGPTMFSAMATRRREMPAHSMSAPTSMKAGKAMMGKELTEVKAICTSVTRFWSTV